jgi:hypothetical protein
MSIMTLTMCMYMSMASSSIITLQPSQLQYHNIRLSSSSSAALPSATVALQLCQLLPSTGYEVLVSYHGAAPIAVSLSWSPAPSRSRSKDAPVRYAHDRHLLDVEKLMFRTNDAAMIEVRLSV